MMLLRGQLTKGTNTSQNTSEYGLPSGTIRTTSAPGIISTFSSSPGQWRSIYFTYSAHYAFKGRYVFDFSVRRDGSTKFGSDQRWGNFPALSAKWIVSDEPWFKKAYKRSFYEKDFCDDGRVCLRRVLLCLQ